MFRVYFVSETAQVELKKGRVYEPPPPTGSPPGSSRRTGCPPSPAGKARLTSNHKLKSVRLLMSCDRRWSTDVDGNRLRWYQYLDVDGMSRGFYVNVRWLQRIDMEGILRGCNGMLRGCYVNAMRMLGALS
jgi:hypothetical protein